MKTWSDIFIKLPLIIGSSFIFMTGHAQDQTLRETLGDAAEIIEHHTQAETARLKVVSVPESRQRALKTTDRIVGYPITSELVSLDKEQSQPLATLLLDNNNYVNIRQRCQNQYFHGIRFSKGQQKIELALGIPCNQIIIAIQGKEKIDWWGSVLGSAATKQVLILLGE